MKLLITGIAGKIGRLVAHKALAAGHEVAGIDRRSWPDCPPGCTLHQMDIRKRSTEEVFRRFRPDAVIHLATVTHLKQSSEDRYKINMLGTRAVFEHCAQYGAKHVVFCGRHTYYGAGPESPLYHDESDPPMSVTSFPELSDLVAADLYACTALWRYPKLATTVLRICYALGPERSGTLAAFMRGPRVPTVLGFDPLFQFMHEWDIADAILLTLAKRLRGVFNVAGPAPVPLSILIRELGRTPIAIPEIMLRLTLGRFGLPKLPKGALEHVKYPVVIDDAAFRSGTGFQYKHDVAETLRSFADS